ncbi:hypothetical protein Tco_1145757, partial [Tanacetum coccineum]
EELSGVHDTFHVSNLKKCLADASLHVLLDEIKVDKTLCFVEEPIEIMDCEIKSLKRSKISLVKVRWNSKSGPEFTWEREDYMKSNCVVRDLEAAFEYPVYGLYLAICCYRAQRCLCVFGSEGLTFLPFVVILVRGDEILRVHEERTLGAAKALMNAKIDEPWISVITVVRDFTDVFPEGLLGLPPQRQVEFRIDLVHGVTPGFYDLVFFVGIAPVLFVKKMDVVLFAVEEEHEVHVKVSVGVTRRREEAVLLPFIANFFRLLNSRTSLTERNQKYEWSWMMRFELGKERSEIKTSKRNEIGSQSEGSSREGTTEGSTMVLEQQMERKGDESLYFMDRI